MGILTVTLLKITNLKDTGMLMMMMMMMMITMYMASVGWCWMMKNDGDNEGRDAVGDLLF
jgi:hypothetical protein